MKVAIIGSGASGLVSMKCCLDEGLQPVCFEQEDSIGGLWYFTPDERHSSVYRSIVINTSKEMMCFSDFPIPKEFPPFMHHSYVMKYFHLFAKHFDLYKNIRFRTKVLEVKKAPDYEETGNLEIYYTELDGENKDLVKREVFNALMVCVGHHSRPHWPAFPGMDLFRGRKIHSHAYKDFKEFQGKNVLVIGIGNSGGDIAVELSRQDDIKVSLSTRRGSWILSRLDKSGLPIDHSHSRRVTQALPSSIRGALLMRAINSRIDHEKLGLKPEHPPWSQHPMVNDDLPNRIMNGTVTLKPNVTTFTETGCEFEDGTSDEHIDDVIFCTGYNIGFNCLDRTILPVDDNNVTLYKYVFPPHLAKPTLAILGCFQPLGAINPIVDLQARWVTRVFKRLERLPTQAEMMEDVRVKREMMSGRYYASRRHTIQVDYVGYSDELADLIGCKPSLWKLLFTDPVLAFRCFFGPCVPSQYRLMGPGAWPGARNAVLNADHNVHFSTKSRALARKGGRAYTIGSMMKVVLLLGLLYAVLWKLVLWH